MILVAHRAGGRIRWNADNRLVPNVLSRMPSREREHPNEKPLDIVSQLVDTHSNEGDLILDPFMGSGTTGVAALKLGRQFIGVEIDEGYFATACRRVESATKQADLFISAPDSAPAEQIDFTEQWAKP